MSTDSDKQERSRLQHEAEHERPHKRSSVLLYLVILFAAAFLLLLMSYFMQQRANQEAMDKLEQTSDSATQSLENILQENETLKVENEALSQQVAQLQEALEDAESASDGEAALVQLEALCYLNPNSRPIQRRALLRCPGCGGRRRGRSGWRGRHGGGTGYGGRWAHRPAATGLQPPGGLPVPHGVAGLIVSRETASGQSPLHSIRRSCAG